MVQLTWRQVLAFRVRRHLLEEGAARGDLSVVVSRTYGLHARVMSSAELAARARIDGLASGAPPARGSNRRPRASAAIRTPSRR